MNITNFKSTIYSFSRHINKFITKKMKTKII